MIRMAPYEWPMKWLRYQAANEKARYEHDRAPMVAMRVQKCPKHTLAQLYAIYAVAHAQKRVATHREDTRRAASNLPASTGIMKRTGGCANTAPALDGTPLRQEHRP